MTEKLRKRRAKRLTPDEVKKYIDCIPDVMFPGINKRALEPGQYGPIITGLMFKIDYRAPKCWLWVTEDASLDTHTPVFHLATTHFSKKIADDFMHKLVRWMLKYKLIESLGMTDMDGNPVEGSIEVVLNEPSEKKRQKRKSKVAELTTAEVADQHADWGTW